MEYSRKILFCYVLKIVIINVTSKENSNYIEQKLARS